MKHQLQTIREFIESVHEGEWAPYAGRYEALTALAELERMAGSQEPVSHATVAGALFDFMGWLTSRRARLVLSSVDNAAPAADAIKEFVAMRGLSINDAQVQTWKEQLAAPPAQQPQEEHLTITWDEQQTRILAVTMQDEEGRILKVLAEAPARQPHERHLLNLLARIHGDGGHYTAEHGLEKSVSDADQKVADLHLKAWEAQQPPEIEVQCPVCSHKFYEWPNDKQPQARPDFTDEWTGYLKDGETPFERFLRERKDLNALTKLYQRALEENERLKAQQPHDRVAVTWDKDRTRILAVTLQDAEGRVLCVIDEAPAQQQYEAGDMASAHNDGFRDGVASVAQQPQAETDDSIAADAYVMACQELEHWQQERRKAGKDAGTTGSLVDGIAWLYGYIDDLEARQPQAEAVPEMHDALCPALTGGDCTCTPPAAIDKAWAQFCGGIGRGPDAPYPGMIEAFEAHYGQVFTDKDWREETGVWAAAWKAAKAHGEAAHQQAEAVHNKPVRVCHIKDVACSEAAVKCGECPDAAPSQAEAVPSDVVRDAERYRWLRNESWAGYNTGKGTPSVYTVDGAGNRRMMLAEEAMDAAIDTAMAQGANHG